MNTPTSEGDLADIVCNAHESFTPLRIAGNGTWLDAGRAVDATETLSTSKLSGITEYVPGDLVLTARAGTTLEEIEIATRRNGQFLALDPIGDARGTLGAAIATASSGPLAVGYGRPRDLVLGLSAISGDGQLLRVGGRVVKNVAGFDLVRLLTGSWGTLGVLTEVSIRLHALPQCDETVMVRLRADALAATLKAFRAMPLSVMAAQLLNPAAASVVVRKRVSEPVLLVRSGGNRARVDAQRELVAQLGESELLDTDVWSRLRTFELSDADAHAVFRVSGGLARTSAVFESIAAPGEASQTLVSTSAGDGITRVVCERTNATAIIRRCLSSGFRVVGERLDDDAWQLLPAPMGTLSEGIRSVFDPHRILNPGMMQNSLARASA